MSPADIYRLAIRLETCKGFRELSFTFTVTVASVLPLAIILQTPEMQTRTALSWECLQTAGISTFPYRRGSPPSL